MWNNELSAHLRAQITETANGSKGAMPERCVDDAADALTQACDALDKLINEAQVLREQLTSADNDDFMRAVFGRRALTGEMFATRAIHDEANSVGQHIVTAATIIRTSLISSES